MNNFFQRSITGFLFVIVIIGSLFIGEIGCALLFLVIIYGTQREFYILMERNNLPSYKLAGLTMGLITFILIFLDLSSDMHVRYGILALPYLLIPVSMIFDTSEKSPFIRFSTTVLGVVYIALPLTLALYMAYATGNYNAELLIAFFALLWANDTFAYLSGMAFGRTKLLERISPKKTWEGFIGGGLATIPFSVLIKNLVSLDFSITDWMIIAVLVVVAGNAGDLAESVLKRSLNVKDSGKVFPGHGGFLDRFDSILLALPAVFAYLYIFKL